jgi:gamma-glutamyltranspeptidase/glutathione hydrolase
MTNRRTRLFFPRAPRAVRTAAAALALGATAGVIALPVARAAFRAPFVAQHYAVATDSTEASRAGADVLGAGGNAADAAVAAALALGVVNNSSSGFGGGGFATICSPRGECTFLDFRETAPAALTPQVMQQAPDPSRAAIAGGLAVGVPGEPAGLLMLSQRFGRLALSRAAAPAVRLARGGFVVTAALAERAAGDRAELARDPGLARIFLPGGVPVAAGSRLRRPLLARTLERYGREGERFVHGAFADAVAQAVRGAGGVMTAADVRDYRPYERIPLRRPFRDLTVVTAPPPSAGGLILLETLAWIDGTPAEQLLHGSSAYDHLLAESWRGGFDDRARYVSDPGPNPSNVAEMLLDPARLARRRAAFDPARTGPVVVIEPARDQGTTHLCVVDREGMMVSLTTTVNLSFGARFTVPGMDVLLNDEINDFSLGTPNNNFGLATARPNALVPGNRPISSMTPTIVLRGGRPVACVGAAGGPRIATATTQVLLNLFVHGMHPEAAVSSPRVHHQGQPDRLLVEPEVPEDVRAALRARGHDVQETGRYPVGISQAIVVSEREGQRSVLAASDPRKGGLPAGR